MEYESILYEVEGTVATITMNRPEMANAQDTRLIDEMDDAFDQADADDAVRVVILAGAGKHFSSGHDLKALIGDGETDKWRLMRETPEGKMYHEKVMYYDRCHMPSPGVSAAPCQREAAGPSTVMTVSWRRLDISLQYSLRALPSGPGCSPRSSRVSVRQLCSWNSFTSM